MLERMELLVNNDVINKLKRERFAILTTDGIKAGDYRRLSNKEIAVLYSLINKK